MKKEFPSGWVLMAAVGVPSRLLSRLLTAGCSKFALRRLAFAAPGR